MQTGSQTKTTRAGRVRHQAMPGAVGLLLLAVTISLFALVDMQLIRISGHGIRLLLLICGGGLLLTGFSELGRKNAFGSMLTFGFGFFWLSLSALFYVPHGTVRVDNPDLLASYVIMWGMFSSLLFLGTLGKAYLLRTAMASLAVYQFSFGAALLIGHAGLQLVAGGFGLSCAWLFLLLAVVRIDGNLKLRRARLAKLGLSAKKP
jgi:uncharacterized protein